MRYYAVCKINKPGGFPVVIARCCQLGYAKRLKVACDERNFKARRNVAVVIKRIDL